MDCKVLVKKRQVPKMENSRKFEAGAPTREKEDGCGQNKTVVLLGSWFQAWKNGETTSLRMRSYAGREVFFLNSEQKSICVR